MRARLIFLAAFGAAIGAGCNAARPPQAPPPGSAVPPPAAQALPPDAPGCAGALARYRSVVDNDLAMGHVNAGVHAQISSEIAEASSACSSGQEGRALSLVRASKSRHGYPG